MEDEKWAEVPGCGGKYEVSSLGGVRSNYKTPRILKQTIRRGLNRGYSYASIVFNGRRRTIEIHSLVLICFIGPRPDGMESFHINNVRHDNRLENLKWATAKENSVHRSQTGGQVKGQAHHKAKLTDAEVVQLKTLAAKGIPRLEILKIFGGLPSGTYDQIVSGKRRRIGHELFPELSHRYRQNPSAIPLSSASCPDNITLLFKR